MIDLERRVARLEALAARRGAAASAADAAFFTAALDLVPSEIRLRMLEVARWRVAEVAAGRSPSYEDLMARLPPDDPREIAQAFAQTWREWQARGGLMSAPAV
jgi:hypothetical protein